MTRENSTVFIVDDDTAVRKALSRLVAAGGYRPRAFGSADEFLKEHDPAEPGCALLDIAMPNVDGLQLQSALTAGGAERPVVFVTGRGDIRQSVAAMKGGAVDFLTKPVEAAELLAAIGRATARDAENRRQRTEQALIWERVSQLTPREREVMMHVVAGRLNKQIAGALGTVEKTIKVHRGRMMTKMGLHSVADLVRVTERIGIHPSN
jgi:FixJ family two-component response regulator